MLIAAYFVWQNSTDSLWKSISQTFRSKTIPFNTYRHRHVHVNMRIVRALMPNEIPIDWLTHKLSQMKHIKRKVNFNFSKLMAGGIHKYVYRKYIYICTYKFLSVYHPSKPMQHKSLAGLATFIITLLSKKLEASVSFSHFTKWTKVFSLSLAPLPEHTLTCTRCHVYYLCKTFNDSLIVTVRPSTDRNQSKPQAKYKKLSTSFRYGK